MCLSSLAVGQELHTFENGEVADAAEINENFEQLDSRLVSLESPTVFQDNVLTSWGGAEGFATIDVDCNTNPKALQEKWKLIGKSRSRVAVNVSGTCLIEDQQLFIFSQHVILDGGSATPYQCNSRARISLPESVGSYFFLDASNNASLFLLCLELEAQSRVSIQGYGNAYIRTFTGVSAVNDNLDIFLKSSTFRNDTAAVAEDNSLTSMSLLAGSIADLRSADIDTLRLSGNSAVTFTGANNVNIGSLIADHRSTVTVTGLRPGPDNGVSLTDCELTTESIMFLEQSVFRDTTDCIHP